MSNRSVRAWTFLTTGAIVALLALDTGISKDIKLTGAYVIPVLIAGLTTTPWRAVGVAALAIAASMISGVVNEAFLHTDHILRALIVVAGAILATQTAVLRQRDLRTRRRMRLINYVGQALDSTTDYAGKFEAFTSAAVIDFADWCVFDRRAADGSRERIALATNADGPLGEEVQLRNEIPSALVAYAERAQQNGPELFEHPPQKLLDALFERRPAGFERDVEVILAPVSVGLDTIGEFYFVARCPTPDFGEAEIAQAASLSRSAALAAEAARLFYELSYAEADLRESRDEIEAIVTNIADGITAQDKSGAIVYANPAAARILGMDSPQDVISSGSEAVRARFVILDADGNPLDPERLPGRRALAGEENPQELVRYKALATGEERWSMVKSSAVRDVDGEPILAISVIEDLTEHMRREASQRFLAEASAALVQTLDYEETLVAVSSAAVPDMADWCTVEMLEDDGELHLVALSQSDEIDPQLGEAVRRLYRGRMDQPIGAPEAIRTGAAQLYPKVTAEMMEQLAQTDEERKLVAHLTISSGVVAPITTHGRPIGAVSLASSVSGRVYNEDDLETVLELGRRAGAAIENSRLHRDRSRMLRTLQQSLIPPRLPPVPGLDLAAHYRPAEIDPQVGGDFYDVFPLPDGTWALVIGDVCGKGPEAAAVTALARYTIRAAAMSEPDPGGILATLNGALLEQAEDDRFCTVAFAKFKANGDGAGEVEVVCAGHPLPVKLSPDGSLAIGRPGTLLGVVDTPDLPTVSEIFRPGESLLLYTDGLSAGEHPDDTEFAVELTRSYLPADASTAVEWIDTAAFESRRGPQRDDVAIVVASKT